MILALLLALSATVFDTGVYPTSPYQNHPAYIHAPSFPFGIPVAPAECVGYKLASTYSFENGAITVSNPFPYPIVQVSLASQFVMQYQAAPGIQYPVLGGLGTFDTYTVPLYVPPGSTATIPLTGGAFGGFEDIFGENIEACGGSVGIATGLQLFHAPSPEHGFSDQKAIFFCPMSAVYVGMVAFEVAPGQYRRADFGYAWVPFVSIDADIGATGTARMYAADGTEL